MWRVYLTIIAASIIAADTAVLTNHDVYMVLKAVFTVSGACLALMLLEIAWR